MLIVGSQVLLWAAVATAVIGVIVIVAAARAFVPIMQAKGPGRR